ncbi:FAD-dependent oxidoreductase [Halegenticoccus soli]|uniref:FAD-dependent oxidoreductase n=1 Tax=Halegenticoccus soli TaxID=1985678 RepID=UPI001E2D3863|nr:FAD-dependent oxidoreductase [Halegenticoccus soli]
MESERYTVAVLGGTPGGVAAAVRAAREGCDALLVTYNDRLGGMMAGGLSYTDTLTTKERAPIVEEFVAAVRDHYESANGGGSEQYEYCEGGYVFEPHVAEGAFERLVDAEPNLDVVRGYRPVAAERSNSLVRSVAFEPFGAGEEDEGDEGSDSVEDDERGAGDEDGARLRVAAETFVDATYEGDLYATVGVPYRVGRESRSEFGEQFAGRLFTDVRGDRYYPREAVGDGDDSAPPDRRGPLDVPPEKCRGDLDLVPHPAGLTEIFPGSTGVGDDAIQAYNYRLCLSREPGNRRRPERPPNYDREAYLGELPEIEESGLRSYLLLRYLPNDKADMNAADLPGENHDYPEADWERRREIADRHREHALGLLYFLQNDDAVPAGVREEAREWGLAADEFEDDDNFPWQLYVREARRLEGRKTFTENDARHAPDLDRTPVHDDAVAIAEYPLDSHACRDERRAGCRPEGFFYASQVTRPSQIPYGALLPKGVNNLLVPVALSATHVGYGTIRLEPTWMHVGEAAGVAAALADEEDAVPANLPVSNLQQALVEGGVMCSFFNECDMGTDADWVPAVQFLGAKGFFDSYDARPGDPLSKPVARAWAGFAAEVLAERGGDPSDRARRLPEPNGTTIAAAAFRDELEAALADGVEVDGAAGGVVFDGVDGSDGVTVSLPDGVDGDEPISRGAACELVYRVLR